MNRIKALDLARGFTVLLIAPIHTMMIYSRLDVRETFLGQAFAIFAEWHGAQVFMMFMGIGFALSKKHALEVTGRRIFYILVAAYLLNVAKFVLPHFFGLIPAALLNELGIPDTLHGYIQLFLIGDILHFAAISMLVLFLVFKLPNYQWFALIIAMCVCLLSPFFWDAHSDNPLINYVLQLFAGEPPAVYFPVLPWIVYPLVGLSTGYFLKNYPQQRVFWGLRDTGWATILTALILKFILHSQSRSFYRTYPVDTLFHVGVVLVALSCWDWIVLNVKQNHFFRLLVYLSENITQVYLIQWVLICWLIPLFGFHRQGMFVSVLAILLTSFLTLGISFLLNSISKKGIVIRD